MARELILYTDESVAQGQRFSNFYGGLLVESPSLNRTVDVIRAARSQYGLLSEIKWSKVDSTNHDRYSCLMNNFFTLVADGGLKIRIMFTQNEHPRQAPPPRRTRETYFKLYYQFIKHAFGLQYSGQPGETARLRLLLDQLPDTSEQAAQFRGYVAGLSRSPGFRHARLSLTPDHIAEVRSHDHVLLQCLDVVVGAIQFRLNNKHLVKPPGSRIRGKRTRAKEKVYQSIQNELQHLRKNFNIGVTTGTDGDPSNYWRHPYRHWLFVANEQRKKAP